MPLRDTVTENNLSIISKGYDLITQVSPPLYAIKALKGGVLDSFFKKQNMFTVALATVPYPLSL